MKHSLERLISEGPTDGGQSELYLHEWWITSRIKAAQPFNSIAELQSWHRFVTSSRQGQWLVYNTLTDTNYLNVEKNVLKKKKTGRILFNMPKYI